VVTVMIDAIFLTGTPYIYNF